MRVNVYSQELTTEVKLISKKSDGLKVTGIPCFPNGTPNGEPRETLPEYLVDVWLKSGKPTVIHATNPYKDIRVEPVVYHAVQLMLHSSDRLCCLLGDDDRSAVTIWLPKSQARRAALYSTLIKMANLVAGAPPETGLD